MNFKSLERTTFPTPVSVVIDNVTYECMYETRRGLHGKGRVITCTVHMQLLVPMCFLICCVVFKVSHRFRILFILITFLYTGALPESCLRGAVPFRHPAHRQTSSERPSDVITLLETSDGKRATLYPLHRTDEQQGSNLEERLHDCSTCSR